MPTWLKSTAQGELALYILLSFVGVGFLLAMQGVEVLPQMVLPVWFIWSMVEIWLRQNSSAKELSYSYAPTDFYPVAHVQ
jgi:hypothetical protein